MNKPVSALAELINISVTDYLSEDFVKKAVEERVAKLVNNAIDDAFRSYSETSKAITDAVEKAVRIERLDLPAYNSLVMEIVSHKVNSILSETINERLEKDLERIFNRAPKTIKLSEIADQMREHHSGGDEYGDVITVIVEPTAYDSYWISLDEDQATQDKNATSVRILVGQEGKIFSGTIQGRDLKHTRPLYSGDTRISTPPRFGLENLILSLYACQSTIEIDEENVVTSVGDC